MENGVQTGIGAGIEPGVGAGGQEIERLPTSSGHRVDNLDQSCRDVDLDRFQHRGEEVGLVGELVIQGTSADTRGERDLFSADFAIAVLGEQSPRRADERSSGRCRTRSLSPSFRFVDFHTICM